MAAMRSRPKYVCFGPVSGSCGKVHGTLSGAEDCIREYWTWSGKNDRSVHSARGPNTPKTAKKAA